MNALDDLKAQVWARVAQKHATQNLVSRFICSYRLQAGLQKGKTVHRPAYNRPKSVDVGADGSYTVTDIEATDQTLTVDKWKAAPVYINEKDLQQVTYDYVVRTSSDAGEVLGEGIDSEVLAEYANAKYTVDADVVTAANVNVHAQKGITTLRDAKCGKGMGWAWVVDSTVDGLITQKFIDSGFNQADAKLVSGSMVYNRKFLNLDCLISNGGLSWTGEVSFAANAANTETIVINGVTFAAVTSIGAAEGNFLIGGDADATATNLANFINDPSTTSATQVGLTGDALEAMEDISAVYEAATKTLTITSVKGRISLTHTMAGSGNGTQNMVLHTLMMKRGAIDFVFQKDISTKEKEVSGKLGKDIVTQALYGYKTFDDGARCMVDVQITTAVDDVNA